MPTTNPSPFDWRNEPSGLRAALDVNNFTVYFLSQLIHTDNDLYKSIIDSQIAAAHAAYREATGEESFNQQIAARMEARKIRDAQLTGGK